MFETALDGNSIRRAAVIVGKTGIKMVRTVDLAKIIMMNAETRATNIMKHVTPL